LTAAACLAVQRPGEVCGVCAEACPAGAIAVAPRTLSLEADRCTGCGRCAAACPTGALEVAGIAAAPVVECARVASDDRNPGAAVVPCLGGITAQHLRAAAGEGVTLIDRGWCADCPVSGGQAAPWDAAMAEARADLDLLALDPEVLRVEPRPTPAQRAGPPPAPAPAPGARLSRRQVFARLVTPPVPRPRAGADARARPTGQAETPGPEARAATLAVLAAGGPIPGALFPAVRVADGFADLLRVARLCPTGALRLEGGEPAERLVFDPARCIACGACAEVPGVRLDLCGEGTHSGPVTLAERVTATCPRCRLRFAPRAGQSVCDGCAKDNDLAALAHGLMRPAPRGG